MWTGVIYLLAACFCWSGVFVIPRYMEGFSPIEISLGRFLCFGGVSVMALLIKRRNLLSRIWWPIWKKAFWLGLISTLICYAATVCCVQYAGSKIATLLFGLVPIIVAICGNYRKKEYPYKVIAFPILSIFIGVILANLEAFSLEAESIPLYLLGFGFGIIAILCWIGYVLFCFDFMQKHKQVDSFDWVLMIGSSTFCVSIVVSGVLVGWQGLERYANLSLGPWVGGSSILGIVGSWLALYFWTKGNLRLPISLVGQLAIFELIFCLIFLYIVEQRVPPIWEFLGLGLMVLGVMQALASIEKRKRAISK